MHRASRAAGMEIPVTSMTLRHSYAVHCLEGSSNIRKVQEALGHLHIATTMRYTRLILPEDAQSPLDILESSERKEAAPKTLEQVAPIEPYVTPLDPTPLLAGDTGLDRARPGSRIHSRPESPPRPPLPRPARSAPRSRLTGENPPDSANFQYRRALKNVTGQAGAMPPSIRRAAILDISPLEG